MPIIPISNGEAVLSDKLTRGAQKAINAAVFAGAKIDLGAMAKGSSGTEVPATNLENATELTVLKLLTKLTVDGKELPITVETLDALPADDYALIAKAASAIANPKEETEKKSEN